MLVFLIDKKRKILIFVAYICDKKAMKKRLLLIIFLFTFLVSSATVFLIWNYLDPYEYPRLAMGLLIFTFTLSLSSITALFLYFFKKIYFRWKVYLQNAVSSFRQWFLLSVFIVLFLTFFNMWAGYIVAVPLSIALLLLELFFQNLQK